MTEFGPAPINQPCPDCGVFPLDGYTSHLTTCPQKHYGPSQSVFPMPRMDYDLKEGLKAEKERFWAPGHTSWRSELADWFRWHWRAIDWTSVIGLVIGVAVIVVLMFFVVFPLLEAMGGRR